MTTFALGQIVDAFVGVCLAATNRRCHRDRFRQIAEIDCVALGQDCRTFEHVGSIPVRCPANRSYTVRHVLRS